METPVSKSQKRAMSLLGIAPADSYEKAAAALEAANCYRDGLPFGIAWRAAAKLSDAELVSRLRKVDVEYGMSAVDIIEYGY